MSEIICPSGFAFRARKFTGRLMAQIAANETGDFVSAAIAQSCIEVTNGGPYALGEKDNRPNWKRVLTGDLTVAFARLVVISRPPTHGDDPEVYLLRVTCDDPTCLDPETLKRTTFSWAVRLCEVPVVPLSAESLDLVKRGNVFQGTLPDGRGYTYKLPTEEDIPVVRKLMSDNGISAAKLQEGAAAAVLIPFTVAARVLSLQGTTSVNAAREEILDLDAWTITDVVAEIGRRDCGFDSFKVLCERCKKEVEVALPPSPRLLERQQKAVSGRLPSSAGTSAG